MKRLLALLLCVVMMLSMFAGCGNKDDDDDDDDDRKSESMFGDKEKEEKEDEEDEEETLMEEETEEQSAEPVTLTIGLPVNATVTSYKDNALTKYLEQELNVNLEFIEYAGGSDINTQIATAAVQGEKLPDILWGINLSDAVINRYGKDGYFCDLSSYFNDRKGASKVFWERLENNLSQGELENVERRMVNPDTGGVYAIPSMELSLVGTIDYQVWINTAWLDAVGMDMPHDQDSLYEVLVAFKTQDPNKNGKMDEIPVYGSEAGGQGADVVNYLINMFLYFNDRKPFNVDDNGNLYTPYTTEEYRQALIFINKLYEEKLIGDAVFNTTAGDLSKTINSGLVGIFCGNLSFHVSSGNAVLDQYEPLPYLENQNVVFNDNTFYRNVYITNDCANVDAAFALIMKMWEEETSYRIRYGEYGVNWEFADAGAVSGYGMPANVKVLNDPIGQMNSCLWSGFNGTLLAYTEETVQLDASASAWDKRKKELEAQSRANADAAAMQCNPNNICPTLVYTDEEAELISMIVTACTDCMKQARTDFIKGDMDPKSDAQWDAYLSQLEDYGVQDWLAVAQRAYDRG